MKYRLPLIAVAASLMATSALAAPVFMLQFGSFESKDEANSHLAELKTKHATDLGALSTSVREITLPPDNLTVYRTQAGPLPTRDEAQNVCTKFSSAGDECYVVETAMMAGGTPIGTNQPSMQAAVAPAPIAPTTTSSEADMTKVAPSPADQAKAAPSVETAAVVDSVKVSPDQPPPEQMLSHDMQNDQPKLGFNAMPPQEAPANPNLAPIANDKPMDVALQEAAQQQPAVTAVANAPAPAPADNHSMWWHMDPFSSDKSAAAKPVKPAVVATAPARPNPFVVDPTTPPPAQVTQVPVAPPTALPPIEPVQVVTAAPVITSAPPVATGAPVDGAFLLPPPPAPLKARDRAALASAPVSVVPPAPPIVSAPLPAPQNTGALPMIAAAPAVTPAQPFQSGPSVPPHSIGASHRTMTAPPASSPIASMPVAVPAAPQVSDALSPSATVGQKTLWAQIGEFNDAQAALSFWGSYRNMHPDFPVVRVRVASPYQAQLRGLNAVSLRIGPFARTESIQNLCATVPADKLHCGSITDMGVAASPDSH